MWLLHASEASVRAEERSALINDFSNTTLRFPVPSNLLRGNQAPTMSAAFNASTKSNAAVAGISAVKHPLTLTHGAPGI